MRRILYFFVLLCLKNFVSAQDNRIIFRGIPVVNISLLDNKTEADINKDTKFNASMSVINASGSTFITSQLFTGNITIKGRGNWTWSQPKRPYNIVTCDAAFKKKSVNLFGMPSGSGWCLLADYEDRTCVRTMYSSAVSYAIGLPWCSRALKVELFINGEYRGLYTFCEKVERDINRVNITDLKTTDNSGDAITGGYTLEQQHPVQLGTDEVYFQDYTGKYWSYKIPDSDKITAQQNSYMQGYWNEFLSKTFNNPLSDTINGYRSMLIPLSFAQYFILQDLSKNGDAYFTSWYITKDRLKKMEAGPGWDWGISWGALNEARNGIYLSQANDTYIPSACPYYDRMLQDTFFSNLVKTTFRMALPKLIQVINDLENYYPKLISTGAIERDLVRWPNIYDNTSFWNYYHTYQEYMNFLLSFSKQRLYYQERALYGLQAAKPVHKDLP